MFCRKALYGAILALGCTGAFASDVPVLDVGNEASGLAVDPVIGYAYVTNYADGTLSEIDMSNATVTTIDAGQNPRRVIADAATHLAYFLNDTSPGFVTVFDEHLNVPVARIAVGDSPRNLAADFPRAELYVSNHDSDSLSVIDLAVGKVITNVAVGYRPGAVDVDRVSGLIYVASEDGNVTIVDQKTRTLAATIAVGNNPGTVSADERTGKAYVNSIDDNTVAVIDGRAGVLIATLPVGAGSTLGTLSALYHRYYLPNAADGTVSIIDTDTDVVLRTVAVGDGPQQVIIDGASARMYVLNQRDGEIAIFDVDGASLTGRAPAGPDPTRFVAGAGQLLVLNEKNGALDAVTLVESPRLPDPTSIVTEYASSGGDFFHTPDALENRVLADGLFGTTWTGTMKFWRVWDAPGTDRAAMCRFASSDLQSVGTHFFTAVGDECEALKQDPQWIYEGTPYYVSLPDASGNCSSGTVPLYRLYNGSPAGGPLHRYTTDAGVKSGMKAAGWQDEGAGADAVFACVPPVSGGAVAAAPAFIADDGSLADANPPLVRYIALPGRTGTLLKRPKG